MKWRWRIWAGLVVLGWSVPAAEGRMLVLSRALYPDTMAGVVDQPRFEAPPAPWLLAAALPEAVVEEAEESAGARVAREYAGEAGRGLGAGVEVAGVGAPLGEVRVIAPEERKDDGSTAYLMLSSLILFCGSTLLGYVTRQHPAYSLNDEFLAMGGRPPPPLLLLPVAPARG